MNKRLLVANRVFQLEASSLDREFSKILDGCINNVNVPSISDELKLISKLYIAWSQIKSHDTPGMKIFNLKFSKQISEYQCQVDPKRYKIIILAICNFLLPYLLQKDRFIKNFFEQNVTCYLKSDLLTFENIVMVGRSLSIVNFLIFLYKGAYPCLQERLLGLVRGIAEEDMNRSKLVNKSQMEFLNRHIIWEVLAEFITRLIPYINIIKIKNQFSKLTQLILLTNTKSRFNYPRSKVQNQKCAICQRQPFNPYIIGCVHIFCYYCVYTRYLQDPNEGFVCSECNYQSRDQTQLQRHRYPRAI